MKNYRLKVVLTGLFVLAVAVYSCYNQPCCPDNQGESLNAFEAEAQDITEVMKKGLPTPAEYLLWCEWRDDRFLKVPGLEDRVRQLLVQEEGE